MLTLLIIVILFFMGYIIPKNSKISVLGWIYLGWLSVTAPTDYLGDYLAYKSAYNDMASYQGLFEGGYTYLESVSNQIGLSFDQFRMMFVLSTIIFLYIAVRRFTKNHALFLAIYLLTFYAYDLIQMRSQFMMSIVLLAYSFLISNKRSKVRLFFAIFLIFLAAQIHSSGYIFLLGILIYILSKNIDNVVKLSLPIAVGASLLIPFLFRSSVFIAIINILGHITGRDVLVEKLLVLFTDGVSISLKLWYFIPLFVSWWIITIVMSNQNKQDISKEASIKYKVLISGCLIGFMGFALLSIAPDYSRLFRHGMTFLIVMMAYYFENDNGIIYLTKEKLSIIAGLMVFIFFSFYVTYLTWGPVAQESVPYLLRFY
ncbi:hypothetical protein DQM10_06145 [Leuconostoc mesenteroides subsp. mesenteroides]|uniref:EpsG family protein n=1 Tax=Leuconostoc mesenteroides TaxID=1245 RepID=UPI000E096C96|nr:EpsG family protein [Leuconostoc mesenteroides]RDF88858.1 hypothetical protein DQM10_06145 [Leuconostoc mesenteroides subsp. mesenteroides]